MKKEVAVLIAIIALLASIFIRATSKARYQSKPTPMRIVQRESDKAYFVERFYNKWEEMGGPYSTLEGAEEQCKWWRAFDAQPHKDTPQLQHITVIKECHER